MSAKKNKKAEKTGSDLAVNRKARHEYQFFDKFEAGIELRGSEVKSCRDGQISFVDAYVHIDGYNAQLVNVHIAPYGNASHFNHDPKRPRKLLLHKNEIRKLSTATREKGLTVIPTRFYLRRGFIKVEIAVARGRTLFDKRQKLRKKQHDIETRKAGFQS